jgi:DNA polymerase-3 subunit beta
MSIAKSRRENATDDFVLEPKGHQKPSPIVPVNPLTQLINCATGTSEVVIRWANGVLRGTVGNVTITTKLISGRFANWRVVLGEGKLPDGHSVVRSDLRTATAAAKVVTTESSKGVLFTFADDALTLSAKSSEAGESEVQCPIDSMADPCRVKLNPHYVEQFLRPFTEDSHPCVVFHVLPGDGKTVLTVGDQYTGIIMPLAE